MDYLEYTGDLHDICVISHLPVNELERPVGFDSRHAYECEYLVHWLTRGRGTNPRTGESIPPQPVSDVVFPLILNGPSLDERVVVAESTLKMLERAGNVVGVCDSECDDVSEFFF